MNRARGEGKLVRDGIDDIYNNVRAVRRGEERESGKGTRVPKRKMTTIGGTIYHEGDIAGIQRVSVSGEVNREIIKAEGWLQHELAGLVFGLRNIPHFQS